MKSFEKKKTTKQEKIDKENTKVNTDIDNLKKQANSKQERKLKANKKSLLEEIKNKEKEYDDKKEKLAQEHQHTIDHYKSLIQFEEKAIADAKEQKAKLIAEAESRLAEISEKKNKTSESHSKKVDSMNKDQEKKTEAVNAKIAELLSKQKSELKELYEQLDEVVKNRNILVDKYDKEKKEALKAYDLLVSQHTKDKENAENYNYTLKADLNKDKAEFDAIVEKHNSQYEELKFFLGSLVESIPAEEKAITSEKKKEYTEREKELEKRAAELKQSFDDDIKRKNVVLDNEIADLKLQLDKNIKEYDHNIKVGQNKNDSIKNDYKLSLDTLTNEKNELLSEINRLDLDYKEKIKNMNQQLTKIKKDNTAFITDLDAKMKAEVDALVTKYENSKNEKISQIKPPINKQLLNIDE